jgi:hypothetical protein
MTTDPETIVTEAIEAEAFCRRLELAWIDLKEKTKEAKEEYDQAVLHLRALFAAESNDAERPLLPDENAPDSVTFTAESIDQVRTMADKLRDMPAKIKRPRNASRR